MEASFDVWCATLPLWLQTAAAGLISDNSLPPPAATEFFAELCLAEVTGSTTGFAAMPVGALDAAANGPRVRIRQIDSLEGINALDSRAELRFDGHDLTVVYGVNGSGKSGFARLTKRAAGARTNAEILPNVFDGSPKSQSARFVVERDDAVVPTSWTPASGPIDALRLVHVFDGEVARHYMTTKAEASYEPRRLRFISDLVALCDRVRIELDRRRASLPSKMPTLSPELAGTVVDTTLRALNATSDPVAIAAKFAWRPENDDRLGALNDALREAAPSERFRAVRERHARLTLTRGRTFVRAQESYGDEAVRSFAELHAHAAASRAAVGAAARAMFAQTLLPEVGAQPWRLMWEAARAYSTSVAYPGCDFPHVDAGARCPLCQQQLDADAAARLARFEAFVRDELERKATEAEQALKNAIEALAPLPALDDWIARFAIVPDSEAPARAAYAALAARRSALAEGLAPESVPGLDVAGLSDAIEREFNALDSQSELFRQAMAGSDRQALETELRELRALAWAAENVAAIVAEIERLRAVAVLEAALKRTSTATLTRKKGELAEEELTTGYQHRFARELSELGGGRLDVQPEPAAKQSKGKFEFTIAIRGASRPTRVDQVLSEGEARVTALAAFLADVTVADARTPFVFDDPISSLDSDFEERVAARLIALARSRQVIVFTHRLSLLALLDELHAKQQKAAKAIEGDRAIVLGEVWLQRMGTRAGIPFRGRIRGASGDGLGKQLKELLGPRLTEVRKLHEATDVDGYSGGMKGLCSELRILTEHVIEEALLNGVVSRFRRGIATKDKLTKLAKIEVNDCTYLDDLMTRYSCYEHSQSSELPAALPEPKEVEHDLGRLGEWLAEFTKRQARA